MIPSALAVSLFSPLKSIGSHGSSLRSLEDNVILPPQKFWYPPLLPAINNDMPLERICFSLTQRNQAAVKCSGSSFIANAICSKLAFDGR